MKLGTTAARGGRTCRLHSASATISTSKRSKPFSANGCAGYRIPSVLKTAGQVTATIYYYKNTHSKQYHKAAKRRARLRTETPLTTPMTSVLAGVCATCPPYGRSALEPIAGYWNSKN